MESVSTRKRRIALAAQKYRHEPLTSLSHHLDLNWLAEAYGSLRKKAAPGVDGQTIADYGKELVENLRDLQKRAKDGSYKAPPVKRAYIPKNESEDRPIGLPTVEDKILQRAVATILEGVYEQEFLPFSFGFRPGRNQQQALEYLRKQCYQQKVRWILEVDLRQFFDRVDHHHMRELLGCRVQDGVITRLVAKWLKAGVWEDGVVDFPDKGTPQGGVISPLLSNIYLHEVLDKWFVDSVQPACSGRTFIVRYADDFIMGFEHLKDAQKVLRVIAKRFARFGLEINTKKTRLVNFTEPIRSWEGQTSPKPETFDFLGFTHYWGKSRTGSYAVKKKTSASRYRRTLKNIREWGMKNFHLPLKVQHHKLNQKLKGHDAYYGVTGNFRMLSRLRNEVANMWRKWLGRRNRGRIPNWTKFQGILTTFPLEPARIVHSAYAVKP